MWPAPEVFLVIGGKLYRTSMHLRGAGFSSIIKREPGGRGARPTHLRRRERVRRLQVVHSIFCLVMLLAASTLVKAEGSGAATYKSKCVICHGSDGTGNTP